VLSDLCFLGRLEPDTGAQVYLEAFAQIQKLDPSRTMVICGSGSLEETMRSYVKAHNLNVTFAGYISEPDPYLRGTKVACVSGYLAILEAMARRVRVAAYYDTPIKEDNLRLAPYASDIVIEGTVEGLARAIEEALSNPENKKGDQLYNFAIEQTWQKLAGQYLELYSSRS